MITLRRPPPAVHFALVMDQDRGIARLPMNIVRQREQIKPACSTKQSLQVVTPCSSTPQVAVLDGFYGTAGLPGTSPPSGVRITTGEDAFEWSMLDTGPPFSFGATLRLVGTPSQLHARLLSSRRTEDSATVIGRTLVERLRAPKSKPRPHSRPGK